MALNEELDVLAQNSMLNTLYTQICCCYSISGPSSHSAIVKSLNDGLEKLSASFPWVAGRTTANESGDYRIIPFEKTPLLVVRDLRQDPSAATMKALREANFPMEMLDESLICPRSTLPGVFEGVAPENYPVMLVQANFIEGGLLLCILGLHSTMDMVGQGTLMSLLSKACRNEPFSEEEISSVNLARASLVPLLDDSYQPGPELAYQIAKPAPPESDTSPASPPPNSTWAYFDFSPTSLASLKDLATKSATLTSGYISTDDSLAALIWQSIARARLPRLGSTTNSTLARAVDVRRYLGIPGSYPGMLQNMTYHTYTLDEIVDMPLGAIASQLRKAVDPKTSSLAYNTRALTTYYSRPTTDRSRVGITATCDPSSDIMLSSWAKVDCYSLDFGLEIGKPESVRRPRFTPFESLLYLMPRSREGMIGAAICLREEDMERLRGDGEFTKLAEFVG
ncbi:putative trichothecene 3-O-acetyltransferase [Aulographum hederae CBS 113979]|uniref:Putative trichothecene 3-O-acetyltransferase n=1 Tax=Aulographum hederae CBS 113979 TaxID=1176131 RepID=A0A6G1GRE9_9PEZI|nr:putative trichothecene 3-O-acetyltransferase [Aulographum hederae CBS 113979]